MSEELPEEYQPTAIRPRVGKPRKKVKYALAIRSSDLSWRTHGREKTDPYQLLEYVPTDADLNAGVPVIVRLNKDGSEETLYVWRVYDRKWKLQAGETDN